LHGGKKGVVGGQEEPLAELVVEEIDLAGIGLNDVDGFVKGVGL